jgi:D-3-phosphoglycerate dehydrogenase
MKVLCVCDIAISLEVMAPMKKLEKYGAEVVFWEDSQMQSPDDITKVMLKTEQEGADSCPADPEVIKQCEDADIIVVHVSPVNSDVLSKAERLKYVAVLRSGLENINVALCRERGIHVISAPGRSAHAVADLTVGLMIAENRNIARGHKDLFDGLWTKYFANIMYVHDMRKCTVGIIGAGQIGQKVIERLKGFRSKIIVHDPFIADGRLREMGYVPVSLEDLLKQSDFVSIHLRLSDKTEKFIGEKELSLMKDSAYFINCARAGLVDEDALIKALAEYRIGGAAIDVFGTEPLPANSPYLKLNNVTLTPHVAGTSVDTFSNSVEIIFDALVKLFEDRPVRRPVE